MKTYTVDVMATSVITKKVEAISKDNAVEKVKWGFGVDIGRKCSDIKYKVV